MKDDSTYRTCDLYIGAAIAVIIDEPPQVNRKDGGKCVFTFPNHPLIPKIVEGFQQRSLDGNLYKFSRALRELKFAIHQI